MELVSPTAKPRVRNAPLETEMATLKRGGSTYKLIYASKIGIACGRQHAGMFKKIARWRPGFANKPGFVLQKQNDVPAQPSNDEPASKKTKWAPSQMGASPKGAVSQFVALDIDMACAIFNPTYVESLKGFIDEEIANGAGTDGYYEERSADKPALRFPPPYVAQGAYQAKSKPAQGTLIVGTGFTNYNIVRHIFSDGEFHFESTDEDSGKPQLLCQITMVDSKADPDAPPMVRFSAPHSDMMAILENERFREMILSRRELRPDTPRPATSAKSAAAGGTSDMESDD